MNICQEKRHTYAVAICSLFITVFTSTPQRKGEENGTTVSLKTILEKLHQKDDIPNFEVSFATKMLATLDTSKPMVDKFVTRHCELNFTTRGVFEERLRNAVEQYEILEQNYREFMQTNQAAEAISKFDKTFPDYTDISPVKKIDFLIMWKEKFGL